MESDNALDAEQDLQDLFRGNDPESDHERYDRLHKFLKQVFSHESWKQSVLLIYDYAVAQNHGGLISMLEGRHPELAQFYEQEGME